MVKQVFETADSSSPMSPVMNTKIVKDSMFRISKPPAGKPKRRMRPSSVHIGNTSPFVPPVGTRRNSRAITTRSSTYWRACEITVAQAAPAMPSFGKPQQPKISSGSTAMLKRLPIRLIQKTTRVLPMPVR